MTAAVAARRSNASVEDLRAGNDGDLSWRKDVVATSLLRRAGTAIVTLLLDPAAAVRPATFAGALRKARSLVSSYSTPQIRPARTETAGRLVEAGFMIALPLAVGVVAVRRHDVPVRLFGLGTVTFVGSQLVHLPLLHVLTRALRGVELGPLRQRPWVANAAIKGIAAGLCEETARYLGYRYLAPRARSWEKGVALGLGHGGAEAIILGTIATAAALRLGPTGSRHAAAFLGAVERLFAITNHVAMSVMLLQVFVRRRWRWLFAAIGWHAALDATAVTLASRLSPFALQAVLGGFAVAALGILRTLKRRPTVPTSPTSRTLHGRALARPRAGQAPDHGRTAPPP